MRMRKKSVAFGPRSDPTSTAVAPRARGAAVDCNAIINNTYANVMINPAIAAAVILFVLGVLSALGSGMADGSADGADRDASNSARPAVIYTDENGTLVIRTPNMSMPVLLNGVDLVARLAALEEKLRTQPQPTPAPTLTPAAQPQPTPAPTQRTSVVRTAMTLPKDVQGNLTDEVVARTTSDGLPIIVFASKAARSVYLCRCLDTECETHILRMLVNDTVVQDPMDLVLRLNSATAVRELPTVVYADETRSSIFVLSCADRECTTTSRQAVLSVSASVPANPGVDLVNEKPVLVVYDGSTIMLVLCEQAACSSKQTKSLLAATFTDVDVIAVPPTTPAKILVIGIESTGGGNSRLRGCLCSDLQCTSKDCTYTGLESSTQYSSGPYNPKSLALVYDPLASVALAISNGMYEMLNHMQTAVTRFGSYGWMRGNLDTSTPGAARLSAIVGPRRNGTTLRPPAVLYRDKTNGTSLASCFDAAPCTFPSGNMYSGPVFSVDGPHFGRFALLKNNVSGYPMVVQMLDSRIGLTLCADITCQV